MKQENKPFDRKGLRLMQEMSKQAKEHGVFDMTLEEINAEIAAARAEQEKNETEE